MKFIHKSSEPEAWKNYRTTEGVTFSAIKELKDALLAEQGHLCCYCMSRLNFDTMKVEHWKPRSYKNLVFEYSNLFAACTGDFCSDEHCDTRKGDSEITINPTFTTSNVENFITYKWSDGSIVHPATYKRDLEQILNLNNIVLKRNRLGALKGVSDVLKLKKYSQSEYQRQLKKFIEKDKDNKFQPYCMIVVRFLEKKLRQFK